MDPMKQLEVMEKEILERFEKMKARIYPCIKPIETETKFEVEREGEMITIDLPHLPFFAGLSVFFALDDGDMFQLIQRRQIPNKMQEEELLQIAMKNLLKDYPFELFEADYGGYALRSNPDHTSSYILLQPLWNKIANQDLNDDLIIAVPVRDIILFIKASDKEHLSLLEETAKKVYENNFKQCSLGLLFYDKETGTMSDYNKDK